MFKTKLQEYCQSNSWLLPEYEVKREGPDHCPRFKSVVLVNGISFTTPVYCRSRKKAQNVVAKFAFEHYTSGCSNLGMTAAITPASTSIQLAETQETSSNGANRATEEDNNMLKDMGHMYKYQLQTYAQKRSVQLPVYSVERAGPAHAGLFKSKVALEGKTYETEEFFNTVKEAENAAAKVAVASIIPEGTQKADLSIYKNLLQEILQKEHSCLPKYTTVGAGLAHMPIFVSTVEIQGETFTGQEAKTKKQAEMNVAKDAYIALRERRFKKDDKLNVVGATVHIMETPNSSSAIIPVVGVTNSSKNVTSDTQPMSDQQIKCEDIGLEATTPNPFTRLHTNSESIQNLEATSSVMELISYPNSSSSITNSQPVGESSSYKNRMKKKIMVLPQRSSKSPHDMKPVHNPKDLLKIPQGPITRTSTKKLALLASPDPSVCTLHSDKKWIAVTKNPLNQPKTERKCDPTC